MKILIDARLYGLENAGLGRYINNIVKELGENDTENEYTILLRKKYFDSLDLPKNWKKVLADFRHYSFREQFLLPKIIKDQNPDLVHFPHFNVPVLFRGSFIVTIHDLLMHRQKGTEATTLSAPFYFIKRLGYGLVFGAAIRNSKAIIVPSQSVKDELIRRYGYAKDKIYITYEGVDANILTTGRSKIQKPYFVYTGNAYPHKNLKRLIQAMVSLNTNYDQKVLLVIVSARNNFTHRLERLIKILDAGNFVRLLGFVDDAELGSLLHNSTGFVFPSLSEGFGLPGLEAMSSGTLVLASEIQVFKEVYKDHAMYFNQLDFSSIEKTMRDALELTDSEREKMIESNKVFVKRYSWDKMAKETLDIYEEKFEKQSSNSLR